MGKLLETIALVLGILLGMYFLGLVGLFVWVMVQPKPTIAEYVNEEWNLDLPIPQKAVDMYKNSELGLGGDGIRYCVFIFEEEPTIFLSNFHENKNEEFEKEFTCFLEDMENFRYVPSEMLPNFRKEYVWKYKWQTQQGNTGYNFPATVSKRDEFVEYLFMAYFPDSRQLHTCEFLW